MATINNRDVSTLTPSTAPSTSTETERAFGLAGEDTAMSLDEYYAEKRKRVKSENEAMLQAYLTGDSAYDGFKYDEEHIRSL